MTNKLSIDWGRLPKELLLMLELIRNEEVEKSPLKDTQNYNNIDWALFLDLAMHHRLYPLLYSKIKIIDENIIPKSIVQTISEEYKKNTFEMLRISAEMVHISKLFAKNGIRLLVLKGPILAVDLYGDLSLRTCNDLDLLVPINDLEKIDKLLLSMGYEKDDSFQIETVLNDWKWRHHHISFIHSNKRIKIEIHWRLNPGPGKEPTFDEMWERKRTSSHQNLSVNYLGREDLFYFLTTHGARHGWSRLRWLVDINRLLNQEIDWNKAKKILNGSESLHIGGQALLLASELLKTPLPRKMMPFISSKYSGRLVQSTMFYLENMVNLHASSLPLKVAKYHERYLFSLMSYSQKCIYILSIFYPSITDVKTLKLPKYLYVLYFPLRPFLLIMRKTRKQTIL
ncbi:nucleotidyltransferase family protein [Neobacillus sp. YIM B06451]|uniref:nucleotidyltransferase domain-containing protein n=1 Tax=Neobacillus sp. YIM B06451 TaxID=3070994 RepID=UPI00292CE6B5|nr:nucleotidyltransferase family protein [Neobacillus sp. YIM B06451]